MIFHSVFELLWYIVLITCFYEDLSHIIKVTVRKTDNIIISQTANLLFPFCLDVFA